MPMTRPTLRGDHRARQIALLAVALWPPTDEASFDDVLRELIELLDEEAARTFAEAALRRSRDVRLDREYHRLFLGPTRPVASPFESVNRDGTSFGSSTAAFLRELRDAGLEPTNAFRLPPDHISVELEYLARLERSAEDARDERRWDEATAWSNRARAFVEGHLARWLPTFRARLEAGAPESPYTALVCTALEVLNLPAGRESA